MTAANANEASDNRGASGANVVALHDETTAPRASREILALARKRYGFLPNLYGALAENPAALEGYWTMLRVFELGSLSPVEQQVVLLSTSVGNACEYCVAAHSAVATWVGAKPGVVEAIRTDATVPDAKLDALRNFTRAIVDRRGHVDDADIRAFTDGGYTRSHVLEVMFGVSLQTLSNYASHAAEHTQGIPLDKQFERFRWHAQAREAAA